MSIIPTFYEQPFCSKVICTCRPSNRLRSVSNMIEKDWIELGKEAFKLKAKINVIQGGLELWKYMS
jgi:hypothetical protein